LTFGIEINIEIMISMDIIVSSKTIEIQGCHFYSIIGVS
jgi:hypothetical protein